MDQSPVAQFGASSFRFAENTPLPLVTYLTVLLVSGMESLLTETSDGPTVPTLGDR
jgi:hypothetical protein